MNQKQFYIERADVGDYAAVCRLIAEEHKLHVLARPDIFQPCDSLLTAEEFECMREDDASFLFTAKNEDGEIAGLCFAKIEETDTPLLKKKKTLYIEDFIVAEPCRRIGIGSMLYTKLKEAASSAGADGVELTVWNFNAEAVSFYRALGMDTQFLRMEETLF